MKYIYPYFPQFVITIIYMLQNTEYSPREFLPWLWTADNFAVIRRYRTLKMTLKARLLVALLAGIIGMLYVIAGLLIAVGFGSSAEVYLILAGVALLFATPLLASTLLMVPLLLGDFIIQKPRERAAYRRAHQRFSEFEGPIIAIAGSFGKTSVRHVLVSILSAGRQVATPRNNHNTPIGLSLFADELSDKDEIIVVELGEYVPGDVAYLAELVHPTMGVVSGINRQHMLRMKTKERTISTVMELADYVDPKKLYINTESDWAAEAATKKNTLFNQSRVGDWKITSAVSDLEGSRFELSKGKTTIKLETSLLGEHQIAPIAAAAVIADSLGLTHKQIKKGVKEITAFERRFEPRQLADNVLLIDDTYNGNPSGFRAGMGFLDGLSVEGRRVYVTPGIIELGTEAHDVHWALGEELAKTSIEHIIFFDTPLSRVMHAAYETAGGSGEVSVLDDQLVFMENIEHFVRPNDVILMQNSQREDYFYTQ